MTIREFFTDYSEDYIDLCIMEYPNDDSDAGDPNIYEAIIYTNMCEPKKMRLEFKDEQPNAYDDHKEPESYLDRTINSWFVACNCIHIVL